VELDLLDEVFVDFFSDFLKNISSFLLKKTLGSNISLTDFSAYLVIPGSLSGLFPAGVVPGIRLLGSGDPKFLSSSGVLTGSGKGTNGLLGNYHSIDSLYSELSNLLILSSLVAHSLGIIKLEDLGSLVFKD